MKARHYIPFLLFLASLAGCKKFLDTKPTDFLNPGNYYETAEQLNYARIGAYNNLGAAALTGWGNYLFAWHADEAYMNRTSLTTGPWNYFYNPADLWTAGMWANLFDGINRTNVVLANVDKNPEIADSIRSKIRGEMLFLRGYYYFQLATYFGGVPLKTEPTSSVVKVDIARSTLSETYAQIISDMEAAEPLVPAITQLGFSGAISKSAVRGVLARVNLTMAGSPLNDKSRYAEARKWAKMVIDDVEAGHTLNPSYPQIFINIAQDKYDIKESIWEVEFWGNQTTQFFEASNNGYINGTDAGPNHGACAAYMSTTSKFYDVFEEGDNRKWWCIAHFTYAAAPAPNGTKNMSALPTQTTKNYGRPAKWRREYETLLPKSINTTPQNNTLLRYSDVLLMFAEAENELNNGPSPDAIEAVNKVRRRGWSTGVRSINITSGGSGYTSAPSVVFSSGDGTGVGPVTATGKATIVGGEVTAITLDRDSTGVMFFREGQYSEPPTITISGGGGSGATASAVIWSKTDADLKPAQTASKDAFLAMLQDERMRELNMECLRKADLLRWGIFLRVYQDMGNKIQTEWPAQAGLISKYYSNATEKDLLMPIPTNEIINNKAMSQNPGW
ncbi:MAG TPA: RagB/SusD family nutrient uptake outer membrane protein [Flavihumibacter sp.]|nr:RagB/SusD family nutrient uptake outer membrane protein [Bacteroidota bacterium]HQD08280.1 RagB/SusD family nutrient uptake outer membrane protein [Flavihumibacter sp.]